MVYLLKGQANVFALPLLELVSIPTHGYLFKITSDYNSDFVAYKNPAVTGEDIRFTRFEFDFLINAGQYRYEVYEYDSTLLAPISEFLLNRVYVGMMKVIESETNSIYL